MALSTQVTWNSLNSGLIQMAGFIQHNFTQDLEQLQALNREWQQFSGQVQSFDDVLNEQQLVEDPTTGVYYEAPYSSYDPDGPDGPGYYTSDGDPLNPVAG
jgi:ABC-type bacteriocin/lantibiotic exporter with double-glycine peptidase domain